MHGTKGKKQKQKQKNKQTNKQTNKQPNKQTNKNKTKTKTKKKHEYLTFGLRQIPLVQTVQTRPSPLEDQNEEGNKENFEGK